MALDVALLRLRRPFPIAPCPWKNVQLFADGGLMRADPRFSPYPWSKSVAYRCYVPSLCPFCHPGKRYFYLSEMWTHRKG